MAIVIYPPTIDWDWMTQRPQQLMQQFALDGHEVYYCNKTQLDDKHITKVEPNLTVVHNNKAFIRRMIPVFKKLGKKIIVWATCAKHFQFIDQYFPDIVVFDYVDDFPSWAPYVASMTQRADLVFTSANELKRQIEYLFPDKLCYLVPNGCNASHFQKYRDGISPKKPVELQNHAGPIIGYMGAWASWVDQELVRHVADSIPEALITVIGPEFGATVDPSIPNLTYLGMKSHEVLPEYLHFFDVCIIPFKINKITRATNPVKMYEYLAAGKPVVSTALPDIEEIPFVQTAADYDAFVEQIKKALSPAFTLNKEEVDEWLSGQTWEKRYQDIKNVMQDWFPLETNSNELTIRANRIHQKILSMVSSHPVILNYHLSFMENGLLLSSPNE